MPDRIHDHWALIEEIARAGRPVQRVAPAAQRALVWGLVALGLGYLSTRMLHRYSPDWFGPHAVIGAANAALCLMLGLGALASSLSISVAGGQPRAPGWMKAGVAAWAALCAISISLSARPMGYVAGAGSYCYPFVVTAGLPMIAAVIVALRRTRSLKPGRSLMTAGIGISFLSFGLLVFCHPAEMSLADFLMHLLAALTLGFITLIAGHRAIRV